MAVIVSRERIKEIVSLWKHWNRCAVSTSHSHGYFTPIFHSDAADGGRFHTYRNEIDCVINVTGKEVRFSEVGCWEGTRNRTPEVRRVFHSLLNQSQHNESKHSQRSLLQRTQNDEEHVEHNITNHIPSLQLLQPSSHHLTPPFTRPSRTPSMNHFRRSFRKERQSTSSPISLLHIRQIDPYASSMLLLCISA